MRPSYLFFSLVVMLLLSCGVVQGWVQTTMSASYQICFLSESTALFLSLDEKSSAMNDSNDDNNNNNNNNNNDSSETVERTSFDQAGKSLIQLADQKRLEQMGDFDSNSYQNDDAVRMRAAVRARAAKVGIQKSTRSAEYIAKKEQEARAAGPPGILRDPNIFAGLDLSQISDTKLKESASKENWDETVPTMFFEPEKEMTLEEQQEADPLMTKSVIEQYLFEASQTQWPSPLDAMREVGIMAAVIALTAVMVIGWDTFLRSLYTSVGFIPSKEDLANYAMRFDGLDLPEGWMDNMNDVDVQQFSEKVNADISSSSSSMSIPPIRSSLPDL